MSMVWDFASHLSTPLGLLFVPQIINEYGEARWNNIYSVPDHMFSAAQQANMRDQQGSRRMRDFLSTPFHSMT
jgi:hypothetical protein